MRSSEGYAGVQTFAVGDISHVGGEHSQGGLVVSSPRESEVELSHQQGRNFFEVFVAQHQVPGDGFHNTIFG